MVFAIDGNAFRRTRVGAFANPDVIPSAARNPEVATAAFPTSGSLAALGMTS
jgi:hypothetical protein